MNGPFDRGACRQLSGSDWASIFGIFKEAKAGSLFLDSPV
jgi:hypothetical protein